MMGRKLKVAIFHLAFIYSGGGEKLVLQEYDGLVKKGHKVNIFTTVIDKRKSYPDIIGKYKIKTFLPQLSAFKGHEAFQTVLTCILAPFFAIRFKGYDCILAANQPSPWIAYVIYKMFGVPYVSYLAQPTRFLYQRSIDKKTGLFFTKKASESLAARLMMNTFRSFSKWADMVSIKNSSSILVNGDHVQKIIKRIYTVNAIFAPAGVKKLRISTAKKDQFLLVTNRHFAQKRLEYAIFVLNSLLQIKPEYGLVITGTHTEYTQKLKSLAEELGILDKVSFMGYVSEHRLVRLYRRALAYLYTAPEEDFGMGIVEAMSFGTPVVAWNNAGPGSIITDGIDGMLAKPFDATDFSNKVTNIITNKSLATRLGRNAQKTVMQNFSLERHIEIIENALAESAEFPIPH